MTKMIGLRDDIARQLDRIKKDRSYSEVIAELLQQKKTPLDELNDAFFSCEETVSGILGEEMKEALEMLRITSVRLLKQREEEKSLTPLFGKVLESLEQMMQDVISQEDQES